MKLKMTLFLILPLLLGIDVCSQASNQYGFKIGFGSSTESSNVIAHDNVLSYKGKFYYSFPLSTYWSLRLNTGYAKRGFASTIYLNSQFQTYKVNFHYLVFSPELVFGKQVNPVSPFVSIGLNGNIFTGYNYHGDYTPYWPEDDLIKAYNRLQFLVNTGTGIMFNNKVYIEIEYFRGILSKTRDKFDANSPKFYDSYIGGSIGLNIASFY